MNHASKHILKQVEWFKKLRTEYGCTEVEMEYQLRVSSQLYHHWRIDVYGSNGKTRFLVEIGKIHPRKRAWLIDYVKQNRDCMLITEQCGDRFAYVDWISAEKQEWIRKENNFPIISS